MRLFGSKVPFIVSEVVQSLTQQELIEVEPESVSEVELDVQSVLKEYLRSERQLTDQAKDIAQSKGLDYSAHQKIKRKLADQKRFGLYEDSVSYIANQLIETLLHTQHVEEIFGEDHELRSVITPVLKKHMSGGDSLDLEVRKRIKNLEEGTQDWDIRYQQTLARIKTPSSSDPSHLIEPCLRARIRLQTSFHDQVRFPRPRDKWAEHFGSSDSIPEGPS